MRKISCYAIFLACIIGFQTVKCQMSAGLDELDWLPKREDIQSGAIMVPENHDSPNGKQIQISYVVLKAKDTGSNRFPMIVFSGGPGANSLSKAKLSVSLEDPIRNERDIILFDQRGIGYSSALPDMSLAAYDIMTRDANEEEELVLAKSMIADYKKKCAAQNIRPEYYNTLQSAKDVGMLFEHLGYKKYNLKGRSYGTRLARVVQDMFPEFIHSSVLDSPAPLSGDFLINRLESYSLALGRILEYCESDTQCKNQYPNLKKDYFNAISRLEQKPLHVTLNDSINITINAQDGVYLIRRLLYQSNARDRAPELIKALIEGDGQIIERVLQYESRLTSSINYTMLLSVEKYENFDSSNTHQVIEERYKKYPLIPVKMGFFDAFYQAGMTWHNNSLNMEDRIFQGSDISTLIFVNRYDPVTPPENGALFMRNLNNGTLLILDEDGHGRGNEKCKNQVMQDFMNGPIEKLNTSCLHLYKH